MDSLTNRTFLNIVFNSSLDVSIRTSQIIRIYWIQNEFILTHIFMNQVLYDSFKNSSKVVSYVMKQIHNTINIDVKMFYNKITTDIMEVDDGEYTDNHDIKRIILLNLLLLCA